eukprot:gi/632979845/ref/XP_007906700.1/ PREDICTED: programmed cell death protein 1-like [Callorhinchus milii]
MLHLSAIAYLCLHFQVADCAAPEVNQSPAYLSISEGKTANLSCVYAVNKCEDVMINWFYKPPNQGNLTCILFSGNPRGKASHRLRNITDIEQNTNWLSIENLQREDSGTYYCVLEILTPPFNNVRGNGSRLVVTGPESQKGQDSWKWLLGCIPMVFLLFLLVIFWRRKAQLPRNTIIACTPSSNKNPPQVLYLL